MPREYRSTGGPASPSPVGFGAADLNLQNPRFVAQTNVAAPENPFAALQQILGLAAQAGGQLMNYRAQEIEGKISFQKAIEAKQDREDVRKEREDARLAQEYVAQGQKTLAQASTSQKVGEIVDATRSSFSPSDTTQMTIGKAQLINQGESQGRELESAEQKAVMDANYAVRAEGLSNIQTAVIANDADSLMIQELNFNIAAKFEPDANAKTNLLALSEKANSERQALESKSEVEENKQKQANAVALRDLVVDVSRPVVAEFRSNVGGLSADLKDVGDASITQAVFDIAKEKIVKDPYIAHLLVNMPEDEQKQFSRLLLSELEPITNAIAAERNASAAKAAEDREISVMVGISSVDIRDGFEAIENNENLSDASKGKAYAKAAQQFIADGTSPIDRLARAEAMITTTNNPKAAVAGAQQTNVLLGDIKAALALERLQYEGQDAGTGVGPVSPTSFGWTAKYDTLDAMLDDVLKRKLGTDLVAVGEAPTSVRELVSTLAGQWETDTRKSVAAQNRETAAITRANGALKKTVKIGDVWDSSPLAVSIKDGSYQKASSADLEPLVQASLIGYADSELPSDLKKVIVDDFDNPRNFALIEAFWNVQNRALDPRARNSALSDPKTGMSWAVGLYVNQLGPEVDPETSASRTIEFVRNLNVFKASANSETLAKNRQNAFNTMSGGIGQDTGYFDFTGPSPREAMDTLPPGDVEVMMQFAAIAACAPSDADRKALYANMMKQSGYRIFPAKDDNGNTVFRMIQNVPRLVPTNQGVDRSTTPLPDPAVLETGDWKDYVNSSKPAVVSYLNETKTLQTNLPPSRGSEYSLEDIEDVRHVIYDTHAQNGFTTIKAKVGGRWLSVPPSYVRLSAEDYEGKRPQREAVRQKAAEALKNKSYKERATLLSL
jgi:hypothetical protein